MVLDHFDVERQQFVRDLVFADRSAQPSIRHDDVRLGIGPCRLCDCQLGRTNVTSEVRLLPFFERNLSFDCQQSDEQLAEHHQPDPRVQQHHAGSLFEDHHAADQQYDARQRPLQQLPQNPHRRIVEDISINPQPSQQQAHARAASRFDPKRNRCATDRFARFASVDPHGLVNRDAPDRRQHELEQQPQTAPRDPTVALQAVRVRATDDHHPRRQQTQPDHADAGPQPISFGLRLEPDAVSGQQIQEHQHADQSATRKRNHHPIGYVRLAGNERWRKENLQIDPRQIATEVFFDDLPNVLIDLSHRPGQDEKRGQRQQRHRQLERRQRPHQFFDQRPNRDVRVRCRAIIQNVCGCHDWSPTG